MLIDNVLFPVHRSWAQTPDQLERGKTLQLATLQGYPQACRFTQVLYCHYYYSPKVVSFSTATLSCVSDSSYNIFLEVQVHGRKEAGQPFEELDWEWSLVANTRHSSSPLRKKYQAKLTQGTATRWVGVVRVAGGGR